MLPPQRDLDNQERKIIRELIRNPRISDNQIAKNTHVPLKTVNRKRKLLEKHNILNYFTAVNNTLKGTGKFTARQLFMVVFKRGISRQYFLEAIKHEQITLFSIKHILDLHLAETEGQLAIIMVVESRIEPDFIEILNVEFIPYLKRLVGEDAIADTKTVTLGPQLRILHNYLAYKNMNHGIIKNDWPNELIFVD